MKYAKAYAAAASIVITFLVGKVGLELSDEVTSSIAVLLTPLVVAFVPNKEESNGDRTDRGTSSHHSSPSDRLPSP